MEIQVSAGWRCADRHTEMHAGVVRRDVLIAGGIQVSARWKRAGIDERHTQV